MPDAREWLIKLNTNETKYSFHPFRYFSKQALISYECVDKQNADYSDYAPTFIIPEAARTAQYIVYRSKVAWNFFINQCSKTTQLPEAYIFNTLHLKHHNNM